MSRSNYSERRAARIDRMREKAVKLEAESARRCEAAHDLLQAIPPGQPILVGHHSERHHRAHLKRVDTHYRKALDADAQAEELNRRADAAEKSRAISSDNPNALDLLRGRLRQAQDLQARMVEANRALRKKDDARLAALGFTEAQIAQLKTPDCMGVVGFASYALTNNSANIRRLQDRIRALEAQQFAEPTTQTIGTVQIVTDPMENRIRLHFPDVPSESLRQELKRSGFRWSRYNSAWQRMPSPQATRLALHLARAYVTETTA
jgi:DNA repair exonuclease SbcCD ATPase subunit